MMMIKERNAAVERKLIIASVIFFLMTFFIHPIAIAFLIIISRFLIEIYIDDSVRIILGLVSSLRHVTSVKDYLIVLGIYMYDFLIVVIKVLILLLMLILAYNRLLDISYLYIKLRRVL